MFLEATVQNSDFLRKSQAGGGGSNQNSGEFQFKGPNTHSGSEFPRGPPTHSGEFLPPRGSSQNSGEFQFRVQSGEFQPLQQPQGPGATSSPRPFAVPGVRAKGLYYSSSLLTKVKQVNKFLLLSNKVDLIWINQASDNPL